MGNVGRFICVLLPFILTAVSLFCLLGATLSSVVGNKNFYSFQLNTTDLSISPASLGISIPHVKRQDSAWHDPGTIASKTGSAAVTIPTTPVPGTGTSIGVQTGNVTAKDLGLSNLYEVGIWSYCYLAADGVTRTCTKPEFDWANKYLNTSNFTQSLSNQLTGQKIQLPKAVVDAVEAFGQIVKWTQIAFILAMVALAVELFFGIFTTCSRLVSCVTYLISGIASVFVFAAAGLATAEAAVVVGIVDSTAKWYGVKAAFNSGFLSLVWFAFLFAAGASFFWLFTVCCCKPEHRPGRKRNNNGPPRAFGDPSHEKLMAHSSYQPLHSPGESNVSMYPSGPQYGNPRGQGAGPRSDIAYEPYSHAHV